MDRPGHDQRYALSSEKMHDELGWRPAISLEDGLRRTVEWYKTNAKWVTGVRGGSYRLFDRTLLSTPRIGSRSLHRGWAKRGRAPRRPARFVQLAESSFRLIWNADWHSNRSCRPFHDAALCSRSVLHPDNEVPARLYGKENINASLHDRTEVWKGP